MTVTLPNSEGARQRWFLFSQIYIKKNLKKIWVNQIFLICYVYINNNSFINLDDGNRIRIVWSCSSNTVKSHNVSYIPLKIWRKTMKKRRNQLILSLLIKKQILIMMKILLTLNDQIQQKKTRKILLWLTSLRAWKIKANWWEIFPKK